MKSRAIVSKSDYREHKSCHRTSRSLGEAGGFKECLFSEDWFRTCWRQQPGRGVGREQEGALATKTGDG